MDTATSDQITANFCAFFWQNHHKLCCGCLEHLVELCMKILNRFECWAWNKQFSCYSHFSVGGVNRFFRKILFDFQFYSKWPLLPPSAHNANKQMGELLWNQLSFSDVNLGAFFWRRKNIGKYAKVFGIDCWAVHEDSENVRIFEVKQSAQSLGPLKYLFLFHSFILNEPL